MTKIVLLTAFLLPFWLFAELHNTEKETDGAGVLQNKKLEVTPIEEEEDSPAKLEAKEKQKLKVDTEATTTEKTEKTEEKSTQKNADTKNEAKTDIKQDSRQNDSHSNDSKPSDSHSSSKASAKNDTWTEADVSKYTDSLNAVEEMNEHSHVGEQP